MAKRMAVLSRSFDMELREKVYSTRPQILGRRPPMPSLVGRTRVQFDPANLISKRYHPGIPFRLEVPRRTIGSYVRLRRLLNPQPSDRSESRGGCEAHSHDAGFRIDLHILERSCIERQPQSHRGNVDTVATRIARRDSDGIAVYLDVAPEGQPSELRMIDDVGRGVPDVPEEVWTVVARKRIERERIRERMERRSQESIAVNIGEHTH